MKRILKAINEGLSTNLIDFGNSKIQKSEKVLENLYKFDLGDYVYYDMAYGYNNRIGDKVAVCVNDDPENELYMMVNHVLYGNTFNHIWALDKTKLSVDNTKSTDNGLNNTKYIKEVYKDEIDGTIWSHLQPNEYIPSYKEFDIFYKNNKNLILEKEGEHFQNFWTSESVEDCPTLAWMYHFNSELVSKEKYSYDFKTLGCNIMVFLDIKNHE